MKNNTLTRAASLAPASWDADARTIDVNFSTFADVQRFDARGPYIERLDPNGLDLSRFVGASVLNAHRQSGLADVLGVVLKATKAGVAKLQLSARADVAHFIADVAAGVIRHLSIGYAVQQWRESVDPKSGARIKTAARWSPHEISFVPVPADFGATTRNQKMEPDENAPEVPAAVNDNAQRNAGIRQLCRAQKMTQAFEDALIDGEGGLIEARAAVETELQRRVVPLRTAHVGVDHSDPAALMQRQIGGLHARATGAKPADNEREFAALSIGEHADALLRRRGISLVGLTREERLTRAIGTGDLPELLTGVGNRTLQASYQAAASPLAGALAKKSTLTDFKSADRLRAGGLGELLPLGEHGEIQHTSREETKEAIRLETFARRIDYSMRAIVNDDLGALSDATAAFGLAAANRDAAELVTLLESNPTMDDGFTLFSTEHNNISLSDLALEVDNLAAIRTAMRSTTDLDGTLLNIKPKFLVVSKELETAGEQFLAQYQSTHFSETNPFTSQLTLVVEPRLAAWSWYVFADPTLAPVLELARLAGREGPQVESQQAWDTWGVSFRCIHHVGVAAIGWRGAHYVVNGGDSNT